ncbi:MAG: regulatory protein GemA [Methylobacillus sp.]|jgi:hypothetical protein|nr:regulatory protein GemA [Methylobacillus sp.]
MTDWRTTERKRELAQIHIAKAQLGLDDETYRDMLWTVGRARSAGDLDHAGRRRVLEHLTARGWKKSRPQQGTDEWAFISTAAEAKRPLLKKILMQCRDLKVSKRYAEAIAKRQCGYGRKLEMMSLGELWVLVGALQRTQDHKGKAQ